MFGLALAAGGGEDDVERLFDHLASHPATARYVARQLAQRFVADDPPPASSSACAGVFRRPAATSAQVMRALFGSAEFWAEAFSDRASRGRPSST